MSTGQCTCFKMEDNRCEKSLYYILNISLSEFQFSDTYKALNPQCVVPTLEIDGSVLTQSVSSPGHAMEMV